MLSEAIVESGRIVVVPARKLPRKPMISQCCLVAHGAGKAWVVPDYAAVPGHSGTMALRGLRVTRLEPAEKGHCLLVLSPFLLIGDHSHIYGQQPAPMSEAGRALRCCASSRRSGTYRCDSGELGACLRTGLKCVAYLVSEGPEGLAVVATAAEQEDEEDEEDEDGGEDD